MEGETISTRKRKASPEGDMGSRKRLNCDEDKADGDTNTDTSNNSEELPDDEDEDLEGDENNDEYLYNDYDSEFDEDDPQETEVEEQEHTLVSLDVKIVVKLYLQEDDNEFESWMETIHVCCSHGGKEIGRAFGRYVKRRRIRTDFWTKMEEPCQELSTVAFELFDRYGRLRQIFKEHTIRKGSGCWGDELDLGSLFIIEEVRVDKAWRRKGVGKRMVTSLVMKSRSGGRRPAFTLVIPGWLNRDIEDETRGKTNAEQRAVRKGAQAIAISFYRLLGFRRIGASLGFGLAANPGHKAHEIPSYADFDPVEEAAEEEDPEGECEDEIAQLLFGGTAKRERVLKMLQTRLPLHHATATLSDDDCVGFYEAFKKDQESMEEFVKTDRLGKNVLHVAAGEFKVNSIKWLLENANGGQTLSSGRNIIGYTPVESLESHIESKRTLEHGRMTICISDQFSGFPDEVVDCLSTLHGVNTEAEKLRLKFGCTCGECVGGFLSPRMKFALLCQSEIGHDMLKDDVDDSGSWCMMHDNMFSHVAPDIQQNFRTNKSLRQGFANIFNHAATTLRANKAPTVDNILEAWQSSGEWPPVTKSFYQRGGTTESVLHTIFSFSRYQDQWAGDGYHMEVFEDDIKSLPQCRNDHEFGFVAFACGVSNL